jgi:fatty-acyl-CoA synthase
VDADLLAKTNKALPISKDSGLDKSEIKDFVKCGAPLPGYEIQVRDEAGCVMPDRHCGTLFVRGPSVMSGYFREDAITRQTLSAQGWLNTGDMAYLIDHEIVITGRKKDLIIINGRNIWPQDMEKIAELQPGLRTGDASAFSISAENHNEIAIMAVECRTSDEVECRRLIRRLQAEIFKYLGITCFIELVPRHTLPRTTSGKLSRSRAKIDFLNRLKAGETEDPFARLDLPYKKAG